MQLLVILRDLKIQLWVILQRGLEVKVPFLGIPLKGVNNPILVLDGIIEPLNIFVNTEAIRQFIMQFNEAVGFECIKEEVYWDSSIPFSSYYIYITDKLANDAIRRCGIPISEDERFEILHLVDEAIFPQNFLVKALRTSLQLNSPILFRDGEEPITVQLEPIRIKIISSYPFDNNPKYLDNSLVHLAGIIPVEYIESKSRNLIEVENGLWSAIYSLPYLQINNWKWIWDLNWVTIIEFSN
ncbi:hypothetical protein SULI_05315 [Saccharolobus solfataricus]|uniref:Uncharacterized protein n=1 Tax=Saccharolobus solfataricus TaxID=2287 RepID=A0A0E3K5M9_SACSO|nr:hypothetical protein [Saccharolobus solfataricus]AKA73414.1 hypothetical protein SULB_1083 [Saccharolobus solfataricus]AKA76113.1 hypothetical protein SULC_1082 [Saccharolobus solfataricus]AKA78805.1 hypothetical protein SULA_1082 [Saccharolobus solfataricus]AZF67880.1 hypothetical protein SULG_05315 [Saccharolobus solfataricus]AZF70500.1 hypothetical protein SULH_05315 [Saccharolobus solfataricus]